MSVIGTLAVALKADTRQFDRGMKRARKGSRGFTRDSRVMRKALIGVGSAFAAVAGVRAMGRYITESLASIDATAKLSDTLGISTEKLIGLNHAASLSGATADDVRTAMVKMNDSIGDAALNGGESARTFAQLGLDLDSLRRLTVDQQFIKIAGALSEVDTVAGQIALSRDIFGRGGDRLLPLIKEGESGIRSMVAEVNDLGTAFNRLDAARVERANNEFKRMGERIKGLKQDLAFLFADIALPAFDKFDRLLDDLAGGSIGGQAIPALRGLTNQDLQRDVNRKNRESFAAEGGIRATIDRLVKERRAGGQARAPLGSPQGTGTDLPPPQILDPPPKDVADEVEEFGDALAEAARDLAGLADVAVGGAGGESRTVGARAVRSLRNVNPSRTLSRDRIPQQQLKVAKDQNTKTDTTNRLLGELIDNQPVLVGV